MSGFARMAWILNISILKSIIFASSELLDPLFSEIFISTDWKKTTGRACRRFQVPAFTMNAGQNPSSCCRIAERGRPSSTKGGKISWFWMILSETLGNLFLGVSTFSRMINTKLSLFCWIFFRVNLSASRQETAVRRKKTDEIIEAVADAVHFLCSKGHEQPEIDKNDSLS